VVGRRPIVVSSAKSSQRLRSGESCCSLGTGTELAPDRQSDGRTEYRRWDVWTDQSWWRHCRLVEDAPFGCGCRPRTCMRLLSTTNRSTAQKCWVLDDSRFIQIWFNPQS